MRENNSYRVATIRLRGVGAMGWALSVASIFGPYCELMLRPGTPAMTRQRLPYSGMLSLVIIPNNSDRAIVEHSLVEALPGTI